MPKINKLILKNAYLGPVADLVDSKIVSSYTDGGLTIIARFGVNKTTLKNILKKEVANG